MSCANPLFAQWIKEWLDEARTTQSGTSSYKSNIVFVYKKAYDNILKYPLPLPSGLDAVKVNGIGKSIAEKLERRLKDHQSGLDPGSKAVESTKRKSKIDSDSEQENDETKAKPAAKKPRKRVVKEYIPAYRSGGYAILMALLRHGQQVAFLTKAEIMRHAQPFCDSSFDVPETMNAGSRYGYTAWANMKTLLDKELVYKQGHPPRFCLTDEGLTLAKKMESVSCQGDLEKLAAKVIPVDEVVPAEPAKPKKPRARKKKESEEVIDITKPPALPCMVVYSPETSSII